MLTNIIYIIGLALLTFSVRVFGQLDKVFVNGNVIFREVDPYYQMRLAENMSANYPHYLRFDAMAQYPNGSIQGYGIVLPGIISTISKVFHVNIDIVGAFVPPVVAALVCVFVYLLCIQVFKSRFIAVFAGVLVALLPTEFMHRSLLGFTDNHVLEVLFSVATIYFLIRVSKKQWGWIIPAILSFMLYALNWIGWPILGFILVMWIIGLIVWRVHLTLPVFVLIFISLAIIPSTRSLLYQFISNVFLGSFGTIQETQSMDFGTYWILYGASGLIAIGGIIVAIYKRLNPLLIWFSIFFIVAMFCEKRWGYYSTIPIAIFASYFVWWLGHFIAKEWRSYVLAFCCFTCLFTTSFYAFGLTKARNNISPEWYNASIWLRDNTPLPYGDSDGYYQVNPGNAQYGVMAWWDYGSWILYLSHRVPIASPTLQESPYYKFFTEPTEKQADNVINGLNIKYLILDQATISNKYYAIWQKVNGSPVGWESTLKNSFVYQLYFGLVANTWHLVHVEGDIKIFEHGV